MQGGSVGKHTRTGVNFLCNSRTTNRYSFLIEFGMSFSFAGPNTPLLPPDELLETFIWKKNDLACAYVRHKLYFSFIWGLLSFRLALIWLDSIYLNTLWCAEATTNLDICTHPGSFGEMCIRCGQRVDEESGVTFGYIHKVYIFWNN